MELRAEAISKIYFRKTGDANYFEAVKKTDLSLNDGEVAVIMGRSGSGKTTLLHMLAGLLQPTEGRVLLGETDLYALEDGKLSLLRNRHLSVVPQARSAVETLTVRENILLPGALYESAPADAEKRAEQWMETLGILPLADSLPKQLSGGELRRMALARAFCSGAEVILADEPTGDLDDENTALVLDLLKSAANQGTAVLLVTHESEALRIADAAYRMDAGQLNPC